MAVAEAAAVLAVGVLAAVEVPVGAAAAPEGGKLQVKLQLLLNKLLKLSARFFPLRFSPDQPDKGFHCPRHPAITLANAKKLFLLNEPGNKNSPVYTRLS
ncbi:MAG: hypothetical protein ACOX0T_06825 [Pelotomaculum sp.]